MELDSSLAQGVVKVPVLDLGVGVLLNEMKFLWEEAETVLAQIRQAVWLPPPSHHVVEQCRK